MNIVIFRLFCVLFFVCFLPAGIFAESDKDLNSTEKENLLRKRLLKKLVFLFKISTMLRA